GEIVAAQLLPAPLQGERPVFRWHRCTRLLAIPASRCDRLRKHLGIDAPESAGVAGGGGQGLIATATDQVIRDVIGAGDAAVAIEEGLDLPLEPPGGGAMGDHFAADPVQVGGAGIEIDRRAESTETKDLRRPLRDVVDVDQSDVE